MKILFIGDYSNYHRCVAGALREMGHIVTVASNGSRWMQTERDIDLSRPFNGKIGGLALWIKVRQLLNRFKDYDIVQINNPVFIELRPNRVKTVFDYLKDNNRSVFLTAMGTDTAYANMCSSPDSPLRYNEWFINGKPGPLYEQMPDNFKAWQQPPLSTHCEYIYNEIDGVISALYEYHIAFEHVLPPEKLSYAGIPIDTEAIKPTTPDTTPKMVRFFLGMHRNRKTEKGTDRIFNAIQAVASKHPDKCRLQIVENVPYSEYLKLMQNSHVLLDQLYSYTPATNALLGMAHGLTAVTGAEPEYYNFIGETENQPIINAVPDDKLLYDMLEDIALHPERIPILATKNREFVIKHNDSKVVARRFLDFWEKRSNNL